MKVTIMTKNQKKMLFEIIKTAMSINTMKQHKKYTSTLFNHLKLNLAAPKGKIFDQFIGFSVKKDPYTGTLEEENFHWS